MHGRLKFDLGCLKGALALDRLFLRTASLFLFAKRIGYLCMGDVR
ncbi:hypothetical protein [Paraburkholderia sp. C35]|nr:hypothetical protein [Paraburkholderia sp. C35]